MTRHHRERLIRQLVHRLSGAARTQAIVRFLSFSPERFAQLYHLARLKKGAVFGKGTKCHLQK